MDGADFPSPVLLHRRDDEDSSSFTALSLNSEDDDLPKNKAVTETTPIIPADNCEEPISTSLPSFSSSHQQQQYQESFLGWQWQEDQPPQLEAAAAAITQNHHNDYSNITQQQQQQHDDSNSTTKLHTLLFLLFTHTPWPSDEAFAAVLSLQPFNSNDNNNDNEIHSAAAASSSSASSASSLLAAPVCMRLAAEVVASAVTEQLFALRQQKQQKEQQQQQVDSSAIVAAEVVGDTTEEEGEGLLDYAAIQSHLATALPSFVHDYLQRHPQQLHGLLLFTSALLFDGDPSRLRFSFDTVRPRTDLSELLEKTAASRNHNNQPSSPVPVQTPLCHVTACIVEAISGSARRVLRCVGYRCCRCGAECYVVASAADVALSFEGAFHHHSTSASSAGAATASMRDGCKAGGNPFAAVPPWKQQQQQQAAAITHPQVGSSSSSNNFPSFRAALPPPPQCGKCASSCFGFEVCSVVTDLMIAVMLTPARLDNSNGNANTTGPRPRSCFSENWGGFGTGQQQPFQLPSLQSPSYLDAAFDGRDDTTSNVSDYSNNNNNNTSCCIFDPSKRKTLVALLSQRELGSRLRGLALQDALRLGSCVDVSGHVVDVARQQQQQQQEGGFFSTASASSACFSSAAGRHPNRVYFVTHDVRPCVGVTPEQLAASASGHVPRPPLSCSSAAGGGCSTPSSFLFDDDDKWIAFIRSQQQQQQHASHAGHEEEEQALLLAFPRLLACSIAPQIVGADVQKLALLLCLLSPAQPLHALVSGPRRTGKSTLLKEFAALVHRSGVYDAASTYFCNGWIGTNAAKLRSFSTFSPTPNPTSSTSSSSKFSRSAPMNSSNIGNPLPCCAHDRHLDDYVACDVAANTDGSLYCVDNANCLSAHAAEVLTRSFFTDSTSSSSHRPSTLEHHNGSTSTSEGGSGATPAALRPFFFPRGFANSSCSAAAPLSFHGSSLFAAAASPPSEVGSGLASMANGLFHLDVVMPRYLGRQLDNAVCRTASRSASVTGWANVNAAGTQQHVVGRRSGSGSVAAVSSQLAGDASAMPSLAVSRAASTEQREAPSLLQTPTRFPPSSPSSSYSCSFPLSHNDLTFDNLHTSDAAATTPSRGNGAINGAASQMSTPSCRLDFLNADNNNNGTVSSLSFPDLQCVIRKLLDFRQLFRARRRREARTQASAGSSSSSSREVHCKLRWMPNCSGSVEARSKISAFVAELLDWTLLNRCAAGAATPTVAAGLGGGVACVDAVVARRALATHCLVLDAFCGAMALCRLSDAPSGSDAEAAIALYRQLLELQEKEGANNNNTTISGINQQQSSHGMPPPPPTPPLSGALAGTAAASMMIMIAKPARKVSKKAFATNFLRRLRYEQSRKGGSSSSSSFLQWSEVEQAAAASYGGGMIDAVQQSWDWRTIVQGMKTEGFLIEVPGGVKVVAGDVF